MTFNKRKRSIILMLTALCLSAALGLCGCYTFEINGVKSTHVNEDGDLIVTYFNGRKENAGSVKDADKSIDGGDANNNITINSQGGSDLSLATAKGLMSTVRVISKYASSLSQSAGVIYKLDKSAGDAYIITNYHAVANSENGISDNISVFIYGSEINDLAISADYVGGSMYYDIAVLKIENSDILKASDAVSVKVADADNVFVGESAIAIGNPEGYGISATCGVISVDSENINIAVEDGTEVSFRVMRIDTAINHGNSGGGLYNTKGELIGIVNAKTSDTSIENIAFAIPVSIATAVADSILDHPDHHTLQRALLGITVQSTDSKAVYNTENGRVSIVETVKVVDVNSDSVAENVLLSGDILKKVSIGERECNITRSYHIVDFMLTARLGDTVNITLERNGKEMTATFAITEDCIVSY